MNETEFNLIKNQDWSNLDGRNTRATGRQIQNFIKQNFLDCEQSINEISNAISGEEGINELVNTINNDVNGTKERLTTAENTIQTLSDKIKTYTVNVGSTDYTQTHNVFRITRPNDSDNNWGIILPNDYNNSNIDQKIELRLGPFDELVTITGENPDVQIQNHKINLSEIVDKGEEIIIKVLTYE